MGQACCALRAEECRGAGAAGEAGEEGSRRRLQGASPRPRTKSGSRTVTCLRAERLGVTEEGSCGRPLGSAERGAAS